MELLLCRTYDPEGEGTNGELYTRISHTIELPWLGNMRNRSCIPEGRYEVLQRFTEKHKHHYILSNVPGRQGILIHAANNALTELKGCIAPVLTHLGPGRGVESRAAIERLDACLIPAYTQNEKVYLTIKNNLQ